MQIINYKEKKCKFCGEVFISTVHNQKYCSKNCVKIKGRKYQKKYSKNHKEQAKKYREENKEKKKEYDIKNKQKIKAYYQSHKEEKKKQYKNKIEQKFKISTFQIEQILNEKYLEQKMNSIIIKQIGPKMLNFILNEKNLQYCSKCKKIYQLNQENFYRNRTYKTGFNRECKKCALNAHKTEKARERVKIYQRERRKIPEIHLNDIFSKRIRAELHGKKLRKHWEELVDYNLIDLKQHLKKQFDENMNWENMGTYWHIHHKIPVTWFSFNSFEDPEFKKCWDLDNIQPLEKIENISKGNKANINELLDYLLFILTTSLKS